MSKGVLVVAAAGNDADTLPSYPAAYPSVVAVGATDAVGHRASFSSRSWVTVAAPGTSITSTSPTSASSGFQLDYDTADGTSFSAPLVAAEAALLWSRSPQREGRRHPCSRRDHRARLRRSRARHRAGRLPRRSRRGRAERRACADHPRRRVVPSQASSAWPQPPPAPKVRFFVDGAPPGCARGPQTAAPPRPPRPRAGWPTAPTPCALSTPARRTLCDAAGTQVAVALGDAAPVDRLAAAVAARSPGPRRSPPTAPGGAVAFFIDGVRRGQDTSAAVRPGLPGGARSPMEPTP